MKRIYPVLALMAGSLSALPATAVEFSVFGDVTVTKGSDEHDKLQFALGELDLYTSHDVSDDTKAFIEIVYKDAGHEGFSVDVERLWIQRYFKEQFQLAAGRFHTPLGFWNYNYHHGVLVQDTVSRPFFLEFEDAHEGLFPTHLVGVQAKGEFFTDQGAFSYQAGIGNNPTIDTTITGLPPEHGYEISVGNTLDYNDDKVLVARLSYTNFEHRWQVGLFGLRNDVVEGGSLDAALNDSLRARGDKLLFQQVVGADFRVSKPKFYVMGEYYQLITVDNSPNATYAPNPVAPHLSSAYYIQLGYKMNRRTTLVARTAALQFEADDSYYNFLKIEQEAHYVLGLRYEMDANNALRFEINHTVPTEGIPHTSGVLQWFFLIF